MNVKIQQSQTTHYDDKILDVILNGEFGSYTGFSRLNRTLAFELSNRNVRVKIEDESPSYQVNKTTADFLNEFKNTNVGSNATKIFSCTVPIGLISNAGKKIIYTMIESSSIHKNYAEKLNMFDEIWVPTQYGKNLLKQNKVYPNIEVMPLGVDVKRYKPNVGSVNFGPTVKNFKFLSVFRWSYRKGYDILLKSFMEEFNASDDVSLILISRPVEYPYKSGIDKMVEDFNNIKASVSKNEDELPHIVLYSKQIPERDMPKIYNSVQAFVLISRGEGFSLPVIEAGASELPVIASNCTAHKDFLNKDNSYLIEPDDYVKASVNGPLSSMAKLCYFYEDQLFPVFDKNSIAQVKESMRKVYEDYGEAKKKAQKLRKLVVNNYSWEMSIDKIYNRLKELNQE
jgi:glycosyltransferase involved in cell wall biosynthesis